MTFVAISTVAASQQGWVSQILFVQRRVHMFTSVEMNIFVTLLIYI